MMTKLSNEVLAYFAGILDGEGTFTIIVNKQHVHTMPWHRGIKRTSRGFQLVPSISFGMKSESMVEWAKQTFGGTTHSRNVGGMHGWRLHRFDAIADLIPQLLPYLRLKNEQAKVVLDFVQHRQEREQKDGHYQATYDDICFELAEKVRSLNNGKHKYSATALRASYETTV